MPIFSNFPSNKADIDNLLKDIPAKTTLVDADTVPLSDSAASSATKKITYANLKKALKAYFDTLYNKYTHPTSSGNKHIPSGGSSGKFLKWSADGTATWAVDNNTWKANSATSEGYVASGAGQANKVWKTDASGVPGWRTDANTTYGNMGGASASAAGSAGLVPAPAAGAQGKFLRGDGTWVFGPETYFGADPITEDTPSAWIALGTGYAIINGNNTVISRPIRENGATETSICIIINKVDSNALFQEWHSLNSAHQVYYRAGNTNGWFDADNNGVWVQTLTINMSLPDAKILSLGAVPKARKVNGKALTGDITITASDLTSGTLGADRLPVVPSTKGGTGKTTLADSANALINALTTGTDAPVDNDYYVVQVTDGGTDNAVCRRKPMSLLWNYIKGKADSIYANKSHGTHVTYSTAAPQANGTAAAGSSGSVARADHVHPAQSTVSGNAGSATKWATARNINGMSVNGEANRVNYGTCSTAAGTAAKVVACTGFALVTGAEVTVKFTVTNTAASPTLNVNSTGAKPIFYRGAAIGAGYLAANRTYTFRYNGTQYELVGDINIDSNTWKANSATSEGYVASGAGQANKVWKTDASGVPAWRTDANTTYGNMGGASASAAGSAGLVPAPAAGAQGKFLRGDGTWQIPSGSYLSSNPITFSAASWGGTEAPYTYSVTISGHGNTTDLVDLMMGDAMTTEQLKVAQSANITKAEWTANTTLKFYAYGEKPTIDLPVKVNIRKL